MEGHVLQFNFCYTFVKLEDVCSFQTFFILEFPTIFLLSRCSKIKRKNLMHIKNKRITNHTSSIIHLEGKKLEEGKIQRFIIRKFYCRPRKLEMFLACKQKYSKVTLERKQKIKLKILRN